MKPVIVACGLSVLLIGEAWGGVLAPTEEQYAAIQAAFLREQFEQVLTLAKPLLTESPNVGTMPAESTAKSARILLWYALSLDRLQRPTEALREIDRLKQLLSGGSLDSLWPEVLVWEGEISRKASQMGRARLTYERLLREFPSTSWRSQAQVGLAAVLVQQRAYKDALEQLKGLDGDELVSAEIARQGVLLDGLCHLQLKEFAMAMERFDRLLGDAAVDSSLRAQALLYQGDALSGLERVDEAIQAYSQAIRTSPESVWAKQARFGIGWTYFQQHRCREAMDIFGTEPPHEAAWPRAELLFAQGSCLKEAGAEEQALARFKALRQLAPAHPLAAEAAVSMAELLERAGRFHEAVLLLEPVMREGLLPAQNDQARLRLGLLYLAQGKSQEASAQFQTVLRTDDPDLRQAAQNGQGDVEAFVGHPEEAARWYEEAFKDSATSRGGLYARYQLGRLKLQASQIPEAIAAFQQVLDHADPSLALDARLAMAFAELSSGQTKQAREELERVPEKGATASQSARADYYLALVTLQEGDAAEAKRLCEEVIQWTPRSDEAFEARLLLADLIADEQSPEAALTSLSELFRATPQPQAPEGLTGRQWGRLARKMGDLSRRSADDAQAIRWYEIAREQLPSQQGELDYLLASCYEEAGDVPVAVARYRAVSQAPWTIRGQLAAAKLLERQQRWQDAAEIYRTVARQPIPEAKIAEERLGFVINAQAETDRHDRR